MAKKAREPKTDLQALFLKRVQEEMDRIGIKRLGLSKRVGAPPQTTLNDIMNGADPRLENVHAIATALGIPPWQLFRERADIERENVTNIKKFPQQPSMIGQRPKSAHKKVR